MGGASQAYSRTSLLVVPAVISLLGGRDDRPRPAAALCLINYHGTTVPALTLHRRAQGFFHSNLLFCGTYSYVDRVHECFPVVGENFIFNTFGVAAKLENR